MDFHTNSIGTLSSTKLPIKLLEMPIEKFNGAVPHFVKIVKAHNNNVMKSLRVNNWDEARKEHLNAARSVNQLRNLLKESDSLRRQVIDSDVRKFDMSVNDAKESAECALKSYEDVKVKLKSNSYQPENDVAREYDDGEHFQKLKVIANISEDIKRQEQLAGSLELIEGDIEDVHYIFKELSQLVHEQGESVDKIEDQVEAAHVNVVEGEGMLCQAVKSKKATYPLMGALIGSMVGGPLGLVVGLKIGSVAAAVGCGVGSVLGFTSGKILKNSNDIVIERAELHRNQIKDQM